MFFEDRIIDQIGKIRIFVGSSDHILTQRIRKLFSVVETIFVGEDEAIIVLVDILSRSSSSLVDIVHDDSEYGVSEFFGFVAFCQEHADIEKCTKTKYSQCLGPGTELRDISVLQLSYFGFLELFSRPSFVAVLV